MSKLRCAIHLSSTNKGSKKPCHSLLHPVKYSHGMRLSNAFNHSPLEQLDPNPLVVVTHSHELAQTMDSALELTPEGIQDAVF